MRRKLLAVAVAVTTATAALIPAGAAQAAQPPSVPYAGSTQGDLGTLEIYVWAEAGVASIRAQLFRFDSGEPVATITEFVLREGTEQAGLWRTPQPLQLAEMGHYRIAVEATDAEGQSGGHEYAGDFLYLVDTWIEAFTVTPMTVTYANPKVAVTGRLMGRWPADRAVRPLGDFPMRALGIAGHPRESGPGKGFRASRVPQRVHPGGDTRRVPVLPGRHGRLADADDGRHRPQPDQP